MVIFANVRVHQREERYGYTPNDIIGAAKRKLKDLWTVGFHEFPLWVSAAVNSTAILALSRTENILTQAVCTGALILNAGMLIYDNQKKKNQLIESTLLDLSSRVSQSLPINAPLAILRDLGRHVFGIEVNRVIQGEQQQDPLNQAEPIEMKFAEKMVRQKKTDVERSR